MKEVLLQPKQDCELAVWKARTQSVQRKARQLVLLVDHRSFKFGRPPSVILPAVLA
jgi:hypothetical protein